MWLALYRATDNAGLENAGADGNGPECLKPGMHNDKAGNA